MKTCAPIFKVHKLHHFFTIRQRSLSEISNFHNQNHFITKAIMTEETNLYKNEHYTCMAGFAIGQNPTTQCIVFLLILKIGLPVFIHHENTSI